MCCHSGLAAINLIARNTGPERGNRRADLFSCRMPRLQWGSVDQMTSRNGKLDEHWANARTFGNFARWSPQFLRSAPARANSASRSQAV